MAEEVTPEALAEALRSKYGKTFCEDLQEALYELLYASEGY